MVGPLIGLALGTAGRLAAKKLAKKAIKSVAKYGKAAKAAKKAFKKVVKAKPAKSKITEEKYFIRNPVKAAKKEGALAAKHAAKSRKHWKGLEKIGMISKKEYRKLTKFNHGGEVTGGIKKIQISGKHWNKDIG